MAGAAFVWNPRNSSGAKKSPGRSSPRSKARRPRA
jgi:hypothetical protein